MPVYYCVIYSAMWLLVTWNIALKILYSLISVSNTPSPYCMYTRIVPELYISSDILDRSSESAILHPIPILIENYVNQQGQQVNRGEYCTTLPCIIRSMTKDLDFMHRSKVNYVSNHFIGYILCLKLA